MQRFSGRCSCSAMASTSSSICLTPTQCNLQDMDSLNRGPQPAERKYLHSSIRRRSADDAQDNERSIAISMAALFARLLNVRRFRRSNQIVGDVSSIMGSSTTFPPLGAFGHFQEKTRDTFFGAFNQQQHTGLNVPKLSYRSGEATRD